MMTRTVMETGIRVSHSQQVQILQHSHTLRFDTFRVVVHLPNALLQLMY